MKKTLALAGAAALAASIGMAAPAQAATKTGGECVQAGIGTLKELGLLQAAAQKQIDYSTLANAKTGPIFLDLEKGSNFSLGQVVKLHTKSPELFAWCR